MQTFGREPHKVRSGHVLSIGKPCTRRTGAPRARSPTDTEPLCLGLRCRRIKSSGWSSSRVRGRVLSSRGLQLESTGPRANNLCENLGGGVHHLSITSLPICRARRYMRTPAISLNNNLSSRLYILMSDYEETSCPHQLVWSN